MSSSTDIFRLDGKRVLVTGASSGLGAHFAEVLARAGASLTLAARRADKLELTAQRLRAQSAAYARHTEVHSLVLDVTNAASVEAAFAAMPLPDVVINNAGMNVQATTLDLTESQWAQVMDTNLKGAWLVSRAAIARWGDSKRPGNIVNVASILGLRVQRQLAAYAASKAALISLTRSLALDYARHGIRANALCPGYCVTDLNREWLASDSGQKLIERIPLRRAGALHELDGALLLLASEASSYMSGSCVVVDGAHTQNTL